MNTNKTLGSNKQHSDRECLYKAEVTMTGKGTRFQEWMPVFFTVNILALVGNDSNLLIVFYVQIMPDDFVMQLHRF